MLGLQRLLKDCEEKAEAAKRPSQQQAAPAPGAPSGTQRRAPGGQTASSGSEEEEGESDGSAAPAPSAPAPAPAPAATGSSAEEHSSGDDGAGSGEGAFVPNLDRLKKLGKRAGPGECLWPLWPVVAEGGRAGRTCMQARACCLCRLVRVASRSLLLLTGDARAPTRLPLFARRRQGEPARRRPCGGGAEEEGGAHKEGQAGARVGRRRRRARQG